ncbi:MAG TPA: hypothetical protein DCS26_02225, partial [Porticoccaceae bacterium]|nr:hypothetical protein [Porticoccaceae bacterium]
MSTADSVINLRTKVALSPTYNRFLSTWLCAITSGCWARRKNLKRSKELFVRDLLTGKSVIPVIVIEREEDAVPLAQALVAGGLNILEITLRTPAAVGGIK